GAPRVIRWPEGGEAPCAALAASLAAVLQGAGAGDEFVAAGIERVRAALAPGRELAAAADDAARELGALDSYVRLTEADRERQGLLAHLRWLDDLHRSKVHSLKSKF